MGILLNKKLLISTWQELSLRKLLPSPPSRSPPRDLATSASSLAAPRSATAAPRPARPSALSAVDPDPATSAPSLAAPRNASAEPRPARPLPPPSAAPPRSERDSVANTPPLYRLALPSGRVSLM